MMSFIVNFPKRKRDSFWIPPGIIDSSWELQGVEVAHSTVFTPCECGFRGGGEYHFDKRIRRRALPIQTYCWVENEGLPWMEFQSNFAWITSNVLQSWKHFQREGQLSPPNWPIQSPSSLRVNLEEYLLKESKRFVCSCWVYTH